MFLRSRQHSSLADCFRVVIALTLLSIATQTEAAPSLSNLTVVQRPGTRLVDLTYNLLAPGLTSVTIKLEISSDGGATWTVPAVSATGAVGESVIPGNTKAIVWNAGADWPGNMSNQVRFRLTVDEGFAHIPSGSFTMGRTSGDTDSDAPPVTVTVSEFYMQKTETTKAQWDEVRAWAVNNGYNDLPSGGGKDSNHPVQRVTWWDVVKWCNARSEKEGLTPVYKTSGAIMKTGATEPAVNWSANGYRLPTEAEWEKAARGGVSGQRFPWNTDTISHTFANYYGSNNYAFDLSPVNNYHPSYTAGGMPYTSPVGSFAANGYGLHDMAGNVWEWCSDWYGNYTDGATDPKGAASGTHRVGRGGSWPNASIYCRIACRNWLMPDGYGHDVGFRPARILGPYSGNSALSQINTIAVTASQRAASKLVDISYDLAAPDFASMAVILEISSDGGATWTVPVTSATGAVGLGIAPGTGKSIVWNAGTDWPRSYSSQMRFRVTAANGAPAGFSFIPAGSFTIGSSSGGTFADAPSVSVVVSGFVIQQKETTKAQWDEVRTWSLSNGYTDLSAGAGKAPNHPVQTVTWWDVVKWCNARSEKEGRTPVYRTSGAVMKTGTNEPEVNWSANGYRLPTEAEWEKAARGGASVKPFPWGTDTISHTLANYYGSSSYAFDLSPINNYHQSYMAGGMPYTSPVGSFAANGYGLHDMAGNVWEWCSDWYAAGSYMAGTTDPRGPATGTYRVRRGGSWSFDSLRCHAAFRGPNNSPGVPNNDVGFRSALSSVSNTAIGSAEISNISVDTSDASAVSSPTAVSITTSGSTLGGVVTAAGGAIITERGVVYSDMETNADPLMGGTGVTKVVATGTTDIFTTEVTGLIQGTSYSFKAYITNSQGTTYTSVASFTTLSTNADLRALTLSSGTLSPAFERGTTIYAANVSNATTSTIITPTRAQANATVEVRANYGTYAAVTNGNPSASLDLNEGMNTVFVRVTAQDGATQTTYTVTVMRLAAPNISSPMSTLLTATGVTVGGNVTADGGAEITERGVVYSVSSANADPLISGTVVTKVIGSGTTGVFTVPVSGLTQGTSYSFKAYATNSQGTTYTSVANFTTLSTNADLIHLSLSRGTLSPIFASGTVTYTASVSNATSSITITPTRAQANATITARVNSGVGYDVTGGNASVAMALNVGMNTVLVRVLAQDGRTLKTYTVTITREKVSAPITLAQLTQVANGTPRPVTASTTPADLTVKTLYAGSTTAPTLPGSYAVTSTIESSLYQGTASGTLTVLGLSGLEQPILSDSTTPAFTNGTDYGNVTLGRVLTRVFTVLNPGAQSVSLSGNPLVEVEGAHSGDFQVSVLPEMVIPAGGSVAFEVRFSPTQPGLRTARVKLVSAAIANGPLTFAVQGFGSLPAPRAQTIAFAPPTTVYLSQSPLQLTATSSSGLPVTLHVISSPSPATLGQNGVLNLASAGTVKVEARQAGNGSFAPAPALLRTITVKADPTTLTLVDLIKTYNGEAQEVGIVGANAADVVVTYRVGTLDSEEPPVNAGQYPVKAVAGDVTKTGTLIINPAPLYVNVENKRRLVGEDNPVLTVLFDGFIGTDNLSLLSKSINLATTASKTSPVGSYTITSSGGAVTTNYKLIHRPGTLVVEGVAGSYEALLKQPGSGLPNGHLALTVPATSRTFTASLRLGQESAAIAYSGNLTLSAQSRLATATLSKTVAGGAYELKVVLSMFGELNVEVRRAGVLVAGADDGIRLLTLPTGQKSAQEGSYTAILEPALPAGQAVPAGAGWATAKVDATGKMTLTGKLADGTAFTAGVAADVAEKPGYRFFVQPYATLRKDSYVGGSFTLAPHPRSAGKSYVAGSNLTWVKAGQPKDLGYRSGFGPVTSTLRIDPWQAPTTTNRLSARLELGVDGRWQVEHSQTGSLTHAVLPTLVGVSATNVVGVLAPLTNTRKWKVTLTPTTGAYSGSFELQELTELRKVNFSGVLRQTPTLTDDLIGAGHYLLPALKTATSNEQTSGAVFFWRPE